MNLPPLLSSEGTLCDLVEESEDRGGAFCQTGEGEREERRSRRGRGEEWRGLRSRGRGERRK